MGKDDEIVKWFVSHKQGIITLLRRQDSFGQQLRSTGLGAMPDKKSGAGRIKRARATIRENSESLN